jgi:hypothetical protein
MPNQKNLSDIRNYLYDQAEVRWWYSLWLSLCAQVLALIATVNNKLWLLAIAGFLALITPIAVAWLREWANNLTQKADKCRRMILYADSLGEDIPSHELAMVRAWTTGIKLQQAPFTSPYYSSSLSNSPQRLMDITTESAYFTEFLAAKTVNYLLVFLVISILILSGIIYFADFATSTATISQENQDMSGVKWAVKAALTAISFILSGDILLLWKKYSDLKLSAQSTFQKCADLRYDKSLSISEAMQVVEDYHLALIQSPPIPLKLYLIYRDPLNQSYQDSHSISSNQP